MFSEVIWNVEMSVTHPLNSQGLKSGEEKESKIMPLLK